MCYNAPMSINAKKLIDKLKTPKKPKAKSLTLYIDSDLFKEFKKACDEVSPSKVVAQMMKEFIDSTKEVKKK